MFLLLSIIALTSRYIDNEVHSVEKEFKYHIELIGLLEYINTVKYKQMTLFAYAMKAERIKNDIISERQIRKDIETESIMYINTIKTIKSVFDNKNIQEVFKIDTAFLNNIIDDVIKSGELFLEIIEKKVVYKNLDEYENKIYELSQSIVDRMNELSEIINLTVITASTDLTQGQMKLKNQVNRSFYVSILISSLTMTVLIIAFIIFSKRLLRQIKESVSFAGRIEQNEFSYRINSTDKDELGLLFHALDRMASQLENYTKKISDKNKKLHNEVEVRKKAEMELKKLQSLLLNIINSMPSILAGIDLKGQITHWNKEAEKITGVTVEKALGKYIYEILPDFFDEMNKIKKSISERKPLTEHKVEKTSGNNTTYEDITIYPLITNGIEGAVIRIDDITGRVKLEEMMIQTEKMLSIGGLAAGMAHEINNPLAGIIQNIQILKNRLSGDSIKDTAAAEECGTSMENIKKFNEKREIFEIIESVMSAGKRASQIVNNMLSFARKSSAVFTDCKISDLLDKSIDLAMNDYDLMKKYDFRSINITRIYDKSLPVIFCDQSKIQQVFLNILKNGAEAMHDKFSAGKDAQPEFIIKTGRLNEKYIKIEIKDNGPGMDENTVKKIFEPFFTTKPADSGTGLGLSISYFIITENHKGSLSVESKKGEGSNFIITLPIRTMQNE